MKGYKKILIGLLILFCGAVGVTWYVFAAKFSDTSEQKADYSLNASDFIKEFQQNDSLANKKYTEKIIIINGVVSEIEAADSSANIKMIDSASGDYIIFAFQQQHLAETKKIKEGQRLSIKGSCSGGTYSQILETRYISFKRAALTTEK
jgi:hypothetical protein